MAYRLFSTANANYVLDLGNHIHNRRDIRIFNGIDALVLESGNSSPVTILESRGALGANKDIFALCERKQIPVYFPDVCINDEREEQIETEKQITHFDSLVMLTIAGYFGFSKGRISGLTKRCVQQVYAGYVYQRQLPVDAGRDAINARKIEEYIVNDVRAYTLKRKPTMGIHFGAHHMGLKQNLCSKERRDLAIFYQRNVYGEDFAPYDPETLHTITIAHFIDGYWITERRRIDFF